MANYDDYVDAQLATKLQTPPPPSSSLSEDAAYVPVVPPWFNDLIQHGFDGLLSIVTKNLSIENADEESGGRRLSLLSTSSLAADDQFRHGQQKRYLIDTNANNAFNGNQQQQHDSEDRENEEGAGEEEDEVGNKDDDNGRSGDGNAIKELMATFATGSPSETPITGGTVVAGDAPASHPFIPATCTGDEDVVSTAEGAIDDAFLTPPDNRSDNRQVNNDEQHQVASGLESCMAPSVHQWQQVLSEEPRPGFVKRQINSMEKTGKCEEVIGGASLTTVTTAITAAASSPANYMEFGNVQVDRGDDASCATRMAGGNNDSDNGHVAEEEDDQRSSMLARIAPPRPPPPQSIKCLGDYGRESISSTSSSTSPVTGKSSTAQEATVHTFSIVATPVNEHAVTSSTEPCNEDNGRRLVQSERSVKQVDGNGSELLVQQLSQHQQEEVVKPDAANLPLTCSSATVSAAGIPARYYEEPREPVGTGQGNALLECGETEAATVSRRLQSEGKCEEEEDERQTASQTSATVAAADDAFQADGHQVKWTSDGQVEACGSGQRLPPSSRQTTCFCSSEGGDDNTDSATAATSLSCTADSADFADCTVLLSCSGDCCCGTQSPIGDLTAACDHNDDDDQQAYGDSSGAGSHHDQLPGDNAILKWPKRQEGEDLVQDNQRRRHSDDRLLLVDNDNIRTLLSGGRQWPVVSERRSVPLCSRATRDGAPNDWAEYDVNEWPHLVAPSDCVNDQQCQSIDADHNDLQVISEGDSQPVGQRSESSLPGAAHLRKSSPLPRTSAGLAKFNDHRNACHRPGLSISTQLLHPSQPSQSSVTITGSPTPPPTPTVPLDNNYSALLFDGLLTPQSPGSPSLLFGQIKRLKHLPRLRSSIVEFERQSSIDSSAASTPSVIVNQSTTSPDTASNSITSSERFIVQIKSLLCLECLRAETRLHLTSGHANSSNSDELYLIRLNLFRRVSKSCPVTVDTDPDVQFSLDQLFQQLSIVKSWPTDGENTATKSDCHTCTGCNRELHFDVSNTTQYRPLIYHRNEPLPASASVLVNLCSRVSHNLSFTFTPTRKDPKMVEESATTTATAPNRLILLRPHSVGCRYYQHHQKRPSSVNSSSSGSDHTKESDPDCLGSDNSASDGPILRFEESDCEYGPGFVGRLCNKFMTMYGQDQTVPGTPVTNGTTNVTQPSLIKRCSSMEELTYRSRNGVAPNGMTITAAQTTVTNGKPAAGNQQSNGHCNHHQQVNGTKKRLLWSTLNGTGHSNNANSHTNGTAKETATNRSTFVKNSHNHPVNGVKAAVPKESTPPPQSNGNGVEKPPVNNTTITTNGAPLYPNNIVKNIVKHHHQSPKASIVSSTAINGGSMLSNSTATTNKNGPVRHYPSPITHNYVRSNLLLTAPLPYIRKAKSVEALTATFSVPSSGAVNGTASSENKLPAYLVPVEVELADDGKLISTGNGLVTSERDESKWTENTATTATAVATAQQITGNVQTNDESVCCYQSHNGEEEQHPQAHVASTTATTNGDRSAIRSNEHDCTADQSIVSPGEQTAAAAAAAALEEAQRRVPPPSLQTEIDCQVPKVVATSDGAASDEVLDDIVIFEDNGCINDHEENDGHHLDSHSTASSLLNDSGICETVTSSLASSTASNGTMIGDNSPPSAGSPLHRRLQISDSEMPKPDIVKTYKRLFETPNGDLATGVPIKSSPSHESADDVATAAVAVNASKCDDSQVKGATTATATPPVIPSRNAKPKSAAPAPPRSTPSPVKPVIPPRRTPVASSVNGTSKTSPSRSLADAPGKSSELSKVRSNLTHSNGPTAPPPRAPMSVATVNSVTAKFAKPPSISKHALPTSPAKVESLNRVAAKSTVTVASSSSPTSVANSKSTTAPKVVHPSGATVAAAASGSTTTHSSAVNVTDKVFPSPSSSPANNRPTALATSSPQPPTAAPCDNATSVAVQLIPTSKVQETAVQQSASTTNASNTITNCLIIDAAKKLKPVANIRPIQSATTVNGVASAKASSASSSIVTSSTRQSPEPAKAKAEVVSTKPVVKNEVKTVAASSPTLVIESKTPSAVVPPPKAMSSSSTVACQKPPASSASSTTEPVTLKPSLLKSTNSQSSQSLSAKSTLWAKSNAPPVGASSVVFDFRDKSVKPNIALQPAPFGSKPIQKRIWQEINGGDGTDYEYDEADEDDANYCGTMEAPAPSGIHFEGENVIAGKSCIMAQRNKNLSIQFNDSAISTTFEYPFDSFDSFTEEDDLTDRGQQNAKPSSNGTSSLQNNMPTGTSNLASYKPSHIKESVDFQLGITKPAAVNAPAPVATFTEPESLSDEVNNHIVPASQDDTVSFSKSSTASDLLF